jgi:hypothetical protein
MNARENEREREREREKEKRERKERREREIIEWVGERTHHHRLTYWKNREPYTYIRIYTLCSS